MQVLEDAAIHRDAILTSRLSLMFKNIDRCRVLFYIVENNGLSVGDLVCRIGITRPHMYQHVRRLQAHGWVRPVRRGAEKAYVCACPRTREIIHAVRLLATQPATTISAQGGIDMRRLSAIGLVG